MKESRIFLIPLTFLLALFGGFAIGDCITSKLDCSQLCGCQAGNGCSCVIAPNGKAAPCKCGDCNCREAKCCKK